MEEIELKTWEELEEKIADEQSEAQKLKSKDSSCSVSDLLFRGQREAKWGLKTTLERFSKQRWSWKNYSKILQKIEPPITSLTSNKYELLDGEYKGWGKPLPNKEFMIYLRHHSFPSPLLDWTVSPYVAGFFAFNEAKNESNAAIYFYRECQGKGINFSGDNYIWGLGPYVRSHQRHYQQQSQYTFCIKKENNTYYYCCHEEVKFGNDQNMLKKYVIPSSERKKVMKKLDLMNINAFSLFGNEEGLMSTLAYREIEGRE